MKLFLTATVGVAALAAPLLLTGPAAAGTDDAGWSTTTQVRAKGAISRSGLSLVGNGFGHGHGLSQYGAQGAAKQGRSYRQILDFYYPGTGTGQAAGTVAVLISADTSDDVAVSARRGLTVTSLGSGRSYPLRTKGVGQWRIKPADHGRRSAVAAKKAGGWRTALTVPGQAQFSAGGKPISLHTPAGTVAYRGVLRSASPSPRGAARDTVNLLPLDAYLGGVVPREVPASWEPAALRAQAVAARTYAAFERREPLARHYQICDTSACQVYGGATAEYASTNAAVKATAHQVRTKRGQPAFTQFSASNGGWSSAGAQPYLVAKKDPYDRAYRGWTDAVSAKELESAFPGSGQFRSASVTQRDGHGRWGGRVVTIKLRFAYATRSISGETFRSYFGLRSSWFDLR